MNFLAMYWPHVSGALLVVLAAAIGAMELQPTDSRKYRYFYHFLHLLPIPNLTMNHRMDNTLGSTPEENPPIRRFPETEITKGK